jgi:hypothetical protein
MNKRAFNIMTVLSYMTHEGDCNKNICRIISASHCGKEYDRMGIELQEF